MDIQEGRILTARGLRLDYRPDRVFNSAKRIFLVLAPSVKVLPLSGASRQGNSVLLLNVLPCYRNHVKWYRQPLKGGIII